MSRLLFDSRPLVIDPTLAKLIGLNEAIIVQQVHYWLENKREAGKEKKIDGFHWVYNTLEEWHKQFPFWSSKTVQRTISKLENKGLLISGCFNKMPTDRTKWYRINYEKLFSLEKRPLGQSDLMEMDISKRTNCPNGTGQSGPMLPEITTDIDNINNNMPKKLSTAKPRFIKLPKEG
jgi:hypothetical protein